MTTTVFRGTIADGDLRLLRVFVTVADSGGFASAEVSLNKTKSAISLDISQLERRLGIVLCTRGRAGFALTDEGRAVYDAAVELLADIDGFQEKVAKATGRLRRTISLHVVDNINSIAEAQLAAAFADFASGHPEVRLRLNTGTPRLVEQAIIDGSTDLAVSVLARDVSSLDLEPLFAERICLYCAASHPLFGVPDSEISLDAVAEFKCVETTVADDPAFAEKLRQLDFAARSTNLDARIMLILSGAYLGFLPTHYAKRWVENGQIRVLLESDFSTENRFYLMTNRAARTNTAAEALASILVTHLKSIESGG